MCTRCTKPVRHATQRISLSLATPAGLSGIGMRASRLPVVVSNAINMWVSMTGTQAPL